MTIFFELDKVLDKKNVSLADLWKEIGLPDGGLSRVASNNFAAIRLTTLDSICNTLDCEPGDILKHVKDNCSDDWPVGKS